MKLAIITSHPIQYNAPWFRMLAAEEKVQIRVFYTWEQSAQGNNFDPGFGKVIQWDIPLLDGYEYEFVRNTSTDPGTHHFKGIVNPGLNKSIRIFQPDCLLVFGWSFQSHLNCMRYFNGKVPVIFRGDSTLLDEQKGFKRTLRRIFLKWVYRHIDKALYVGTNNKAYFLAHGLRERDLVFAPHAIDNRRFADDSGILRREAAAWRARLGFSPSDIVVLFAGKLEFKKDPGILLELAQRLSDERVKFLIVGNGEMEQELKQKAVHIKRIQFLDFQNQGKMPVVYRLANLFILPSRGPGETWGLALNEAMACGLPVAASDKVGGAVDLIRHGENGFIFPAGDVEALHTQLLRYIIPNKLQDMGMRSEAIIQNWSFNHIVASINSIINAMRS